MIRNLLYVYTLIYGVIPERAQQCIDHNITMCERAGVTFKIIPFTVNKGESPAGMANFLRLTKAATEPRILYIDWDIKIKSFPEFDPQAPMMGDHTYYGIKCIDHWAIYNGDRLEVFREILNLYTGRIGIFSSYFKIFNMQKLQCKFKRITTFEHLALAQGRKEL